MSGYSDYDDASEYDDSNYEDDYAGAIGGYDDDMEEAGYDAWDIENPEHDFDDERPMFEFAPFSEYFDLVNEDGDVLMTYQALGKLAEMTAKLLVVWEKRAAVMHIEKQDPTPLDIEGDDDDPLFQGLNLYQLEVEKRSDLRSYSVRRLEMLLGGKEKVMKLKQVVNNISNFVKRIILASVGNSLPSPMPYPVINIILSYLLPVKGAVNIGLVTNDDSKEGERKEMKRLYLVMAEVFGHVQVIMFISGPITIEFSTYHQYITEEIELLVEMFEVLVERVKSTGLQISFEGLDIKRYQG